MNYWRWLFIGEKEKPGIYKFWNGWLVAHFLSGIILAWLLPICMKEAASAFLLPLASIFIGLAFAWGGNAQALLQTEEIEEFSRYHEGGIENYVYTYQTAILVILGTLVLWGLAGVGIYDSLLAGYPIVFFLVKIFLFFTASLTLRECWHVVLGSQYLLISRKKIRDRTNRKKN